MALSSSSGSPGANFLGVDPEKFLKLLSNDQATQLDDFISEYDREPGEQFSRLDSRRLFDLPVQSLLESSSVQPKPFEFLFYHLGDSSSFIRSQRERYLSGSIVLLPGQSDEFPGLYGLLLPESN